MAAHLEASKVVFVVACACIVVLFLNAIRPGYETLVLNVASDDISVKEYFKIDHDHHMEPVTMTMEDVAILKQKQRHLAVESACYKHKDKLIHDASKLTGQHLSHLLVNDKYKILYCYVPKVACSNWRRVFLILQGMSTEKALSLDRQAVHSNGVKSMAAYSGKPEEIERRLRNYTTFMFVRDPYERILSAYRDKLANDSIADVGFRRWLSYKLVKTKYSSPGNYQTFDAFMQFLANEPDSTSREPPMRFPENEHWNQYYDFCNPCAIHYDVIGKYETLDDDANFILKKANISKSVVTFPHKKTKHEQNGKTSSTIKKFFAQISSSLVERVGKLYALDFEMFSYSPENPATR